MRRFILTLCTAAYGLLAVWAYVSQAAPPGSPLAKMEAPLRWAPNQPVVWEQLGRMYLFDPSASDPARAEAAFFRAAEANPMAPAIWTGLADTYLQMGETQK